MAQQPAWNSWGQDSVIHLFNASLGSEHFGAFPGGSDECNSAESFSKAHIVGQYSAGRFTGALSALCRGHRVAVPV